MSRKVLINRLAEALNCQPNDIPNVNELTNNQIYWMIQHERLHKRHGAMHRLTNHIKDMAINPVLTHQWLK